MRDGNKDGRGMARWLVGIAVAVACIGAASVVSASPPSSEGFTAAVIGSGTTDHNWGFRAVVGKKTVVSQFNLEPGAYGGWHHHYGRTLVTVMTGEVTLYHADCSSQTYVAGDAFVEQAGVVHIPATPVMSRCSSRRCSSGCRLTPRHPASRTIRRRDVM